MVNVLLIVFFVTNIASASIVIAAAKRHGKSSKWGCAECKHCMADIGFSMNQCRYKVDIV